MRKFLFLFFLLISNFLLAQIDDPIPAEISYSGLVVKLQEVVTIPPSSSEKPFARINLLRECPDESGRLFVNDLRGQFWVIENGTPSLFANLATEFSNFIDAPGKGTGFGAFAFHPDFANNGLFYTAHTESTGSGVADYVPLAFDEITMQWILTEWQMTESSNNVFTGSKRELLRFDFPGIFHGMQEIAFNPNASVGEEDYGLLYVCLGDGATSLNFLKQNLQTTESFLGTIFRIDPLGNNSSNGEYGIPPNNPFTNSTNPNVLKEIYAYGFRNPHRISWDTAGDHKMLEGDIGEKNIEEVNQILPGHNYGWSEREGTFLYNRDLGREHVWALPADDSLNNYTYPVAQYDHDVGVAIIGGYVYRGDNFPELEGQYIFGDIVSGFLFHVPVDDLELGSQATISQLATLGEDGFGTSLLAEVNYDRTDLRFGMDAVGEIYVLTKADGKIRQLVHPDVVSVAQIRNQQEVNWLTPNPSNGVFTLSKNNNLITNYSIQVFNVVGKKVFNQLDIQEGESIDLTQLPQGTYWAYFFNEKKEYFQKIIVH